MNVKNLVLGIGIFIVYMFALGYGIEAFYESPKYENFCSFDRFAYPKPVDIVRNASCTFSFELQKQADLCYANRGQPVYSYDEHGCYSGLTCDYCNKKFDEANKEYSKILFIIAIIIGALTLIVGYAILSVEPVGSALMASGIGAIIYGSMRNWMNLSDYIRFFLLFIALVLLIWIALRINRREKKSWMFWKKF